jgi:molybdopterin converting factor small subunit
MHVTVRFFGIVGDIADRKSQIVELQDGATIAELLASLSTGNPGFARIEKQVRAVADGTNVTRDHVLSPDGEVVLVRAIGGGTR